MMTQLPLVDVVDGMKVVAFDLECNFRSITPVRPFSAAASRRFAITMNIEVCRSLGLGKLIPQEKKSDCTY